MLPGSEVVIGVDPGDTRTLLHAHAWVEIAHCPLRPGDPRGQEITPTVIFKLRNFHSRRTIAAEITVAMPKTTLSFVKGATQGKS